MTTHARLTNLPAALRSAGYSEPACYRKLREAAINGQLPAYQINNIWHYDVSQVHAIAMALGMTADRTAA